MFVLRCIVSSKDADWRWGGQTVRASGRDDDDEGVKMGMVDEDDDEDEEDDENEDDDDILTNDIFSQ